MVKTHRADGTTVPALVLRDRKLYRILDDEWIELRVRKWPCAHTDLGRVGVGFFELELQIYEIGTKLSLIEVNWASGMTLGSSDHVWRAVQRYEGEIIESGKIQATFEALEVTRFRPKIS